jgi:lysophosphatidylcholine acyltransferase/lyso-PAF acetyltransferase
MFAFIALIGYSSKDARKPMPAWRNWLRPLAVFWSRGLFFFGGFHWVTVKGERVTAKEAPILVMAPHSSYFDALPITYLGLTTVVAKTSAITVPIFGTLTKFTQPVLVDREDPNSRQNTVKEILRRSATGGDWPQIAIFPEGTCTNRTCLISFKPGAFIPGVPVQPVCVKYPNKLDNVTWTWCAIGALKTLYYTLCRFHTRCEIEFLPVYVPSEEEKKDPKLFAQNVRLKMAEALGVPVTEHSYEDGEILCRVSDLGLPCTSYLVNLHLQMRLSGVKLSHDVLERLIQALHQIPSFWVNETEFASTLSSYIPLETCQQLFILYSKEHGQVLDNLTVVDLRQVIVDLVLLCKPASAVDVLRSACLVYDHANKGSLTVTELHDVLQAVCRCSISMLSVPADSKNRTFTYDEVKLFAASISPKFTKVFTNNLQPTVGAIPNHASSSSSTLQTNHCPSASCGDNFHTARRAKAD